MDVLALDLGRGFVATLDADCWERTFVYHSRKYGSAQYRPCDLKWWPHKNRNHWYAVASGCIVKALPLHRLLVEAPAHLLVDHEDGNTLRNVMANLRICTIAQNSQNVGGRSGASRFKGVRLTRGGKLWQSQIHTTENGKHLCLHLGQFTDEADAARAYDAAALIHFGEFARLNFPPQPVAAAG